MIDNKLSLHLGKTGAMIAGSKNKLKRINDFKIECNNQTIKGVKSVKYLGIHLDQCASGMVTCQVIIKKINTKLQFLYRQAKYLNQDIKKTFCSALIQIMLAYHGSQTLINNAKSGSKLPKTRLLDLSLA